MSSAHSVIIGDSNDPHVSAVLDLCGASTLVIDAATIAGSRYQLDSGRLVIRSGLAHDEPVVLDAACHAHGWVRRLAPPDWQRGVVVESHAAAVKVAWLSLLTAVLRTCGVDWLTNVDDLMTSENKLIQEAAATRVGAPTPKTVVTNEIEVARDLVGPEFVLKPLGPGHFFEDGQPYAVFTTATSADILNTDAFASAPFIAQQRLFARQHLRVVTVGNQAWAAELDAGDRPLDWRRQPEAHGSFHDVSAPRDVMTHANAVANEMRLGFSSQDWVVTEEGPYLVDVNPAGQWLFLPQATADCVTAALAAWLIGACDDHG